MPFQFEQFLNVRAAYGPTVDAAGDRLYFLTDLTGSPALWSLSLAKPGAWPEPLVTRLDRVRQAFPGPRPGQLVIEADTGGNERIQLYLLERHGGMPRPLTHDPAVIHWFGSWHPDGRTIAISTTERDQPSFDVSPLDVEPGDRRCLWQTDGVCKPDQFSPDGKTLLVHRSDGPMDH